MPKHVLLITFLSTLSLLVSPTAADDYWQQEVNYRIDVTLDDDLRTINGSIDIEYINNSPDTLGVIFLKAFPNAIQKGSYSDLKRRTMNNYNFANLKPEQEGSLELYNRTYSDDLHRSYRTFEFDNTVVTVYLNRPLLPGDTVTLPFDFKTILPRPDNMRMGLTQGVTKAAYWYPQVCVYDHVLGWVNAQYIGWGECYGDFGTFDVTITAPEDQIVAATGVLVNETEALPDNLRAKLDITNYFKPQHEWPELYLDPSEQKTWHYVAEKVNDFAWTSSNNFCIDSDTINGVKIVAYPLRHKAERWKTAVEIGKQAVETFSELYYPYQWPVVRICDAYSGMEYPMITNCSGGGPSPRFPFLLYHEIGHNWFMGQVGSNQVDRPFLDEGFTTHLEHNAMEKYFGRHGNFHYYTKWYEKMFAPPLDIRDDRGFRPLLLLMKEDFDKPMAVAYDRGEEYWPYRVSMYYKCVAMHYSLRSILGDSAYFDAMHHYCDKWFFRHPYEDDFTEAMEEATGIEFDAYLQQWYYQRYRLDYAFDKMKAHRRGRTWETTIQLKRNEKLVSPVDIAVIWEQGDTTFYTLPPEGMAYTKPDYVLLPTWHQFRRLEETYEFTVTAERKVRKVVVDPYNLLMDIDRMNNQSGFLPPIELRMDNLVYDCTPVNKYALRWRPDLWYDEPNGLQVGFRWHGSYLETERRFSLDFRVGTETGRPVIDAIQRNPFKLFGSHSTLSHRFLRADRRTYSSLSYGKQFRKWYSRPDMEHFNLLFEYMNTSGSQGNRLDPFPTHVRQYLPDMTWDAAHTFYARLTNGILRTFRYGRFGFTTREAVGTFEENDRHRAFTEWQFQLDLELGNHRRTWWTMRLEYAATDGESPSHYLNHLSRARSIDRFSRTQLFRSPGTFPADWEDDFYFANGRVRGYQDRAVYWRDFIGGSTQFTLPDLLPYRWLRVIPMVGGFLSRCDQALFVDGGQISFGGKEIYYPEPVASNETRQDDTKFYLSAGISLVLPSVWHGQRVRLDFPVYLNEPAEGDDKFEFRFSVAWLIPEGQ